MCVKLIFYYKTVFKYVVYDPFYTGEWSLQITLVILF